MEIVILLLYYEKHKGHEADRKTFALGDKDDRKMAEARVAWGGAKSKSVWRGRTVVKGKDGDDEDQESNGDGGARREEGPRDTLCSHYLIFAFGKWEMGMN